MDAVIQAAAEFLCGDAALVGGQVRGRVAVGQVGTEGRDKEELAHDEDQGDGTYAEQILHSGLTADHHVARNGVKQHFQAAAGAVLGQHLDELDADHDVQSPLEERPDLDIVSVNEQARHPFQEGDEAEQQADEYQPGQQDLQQGGGLDDVVAQGGPGVAFYPGIVRGGSGF